MSHKINGIHFQQYSNDPIMIRTDYDANMKFESSFNNVDFTIKKGYFYAFGNGVKIIILLELNRIHPMFEFLL